MLIPRTLCHQGLSTARSELARTTTSSLPVLCRLQMLLRCQRLPFLNPSFGGGSNCNVRIPFSHYIKHSTCSPGDLIRLTHTTSFCSFQYRSRRRTSRICRSFYCFSEWKVRLAWYHRSTPSHVCRRLGLKLWNRREWPVHGSPGRPHIPVSRAQG